MSTRTLSNDYGSIATEPSTAAAVGLEHLPPRTRVQRIRWQPPVPLADQGLPRQSLNFIGVQDHDGNLRIVPESSGELVNYAIPIGTEIMRETMRLTGEQIFGLRASVLAYRWLCGRGAKFRRKLSMDDLRRRQPELADLGPDAFGKGRKWSLAELARQGREAAIAAGIRRPRPAEVVAHGLCAAALRNPLHVEPECSNSLMRMVLFAAPEPVSVTDDDRNEIQSRLSQAIEEHADDSQAKFDKWFSEGNSNLPKSLANRKTADFGKLPIAAVNHVLQDLGWDGHQTVANCLRATMYWVEKSLCEGQLPVARDWFEEVYLPQSKYGNLSLLMLMDRATLIKPIVLQLWDSPNDSKLIGALHRTLHYYEEIVDTRRAAERQSKRRRLSSKPAGGRRSEPLSNQVQELDVPGAVSQLLAMVNRLAKQRGVYCKKCDRDLSFRLAEIVPEQEQLVEFTGTCTHCSHRQSIELERADVLSALEVKNQPVNLSANRNGKRPRPR